MPFLNNRAIQEDDTTLTDRSVDFNDFDSSTAFEIVAAEDALYVGAYFPFNARHFEIGTANSNASAVSVAVTDSSGDFQAVTDITDQTSSGGVSFAQSGHISWNLTSSSPGNTWVAKDTKDISDLSSLDIRGLYWAKFTWSADFSAGTTLKKIGFKFSDDNDLIRRYPRLVNNTKYFAAFASSKTDWDEQHHLAADEVIRELQRKSLIVSPNQLIRYDYLTDASTHKVAEIIYNGLGDSAADDAKRANEYHRDAINLFRIDANQNRDLDLSESEITITVDEIAVRR